ncbi:uncharacterized protein LOC110181111 [Drosophila serrata]|uniref:uncharacterized protein LOC110181111 n=1 Tax=Drosophila serrata TaxID=7274 RepID=UPI000A1D38B8|nr:uncharacterized protein LOC110181111 [Drosophila serrata]
MFRRASRVLCLLKTTNVLANTKIRYCRFSDIYQGGKDNGGIKPYHVKLLEVNKGKEARIMELTAQIEGIQNKIKALQMLKSAEAKSALDEMNEILKDLKDALRTLRMSN